MAKAKKSNAGRKPIADKKQEVRLFVEQSKIDLLGGKEQVRQVSYKAIDKATTKKRLMQ